MTSFPTPAVVSAAAILLAILVALVALVVANRRRPTPEQVRDRLVAQIIADVRERFTDEGILADCGLINNRNFRTLMGADGHWRVTGIIQTVVFDAENWPAWVHFVDSVVMARIADLANAAAPGYAPAGDLDIETRIIYVLNALLASLPARVETVDA